MPLFNPSINNYSATVLILFDQNQYSIVYQLGTREDDVDEGCHFGQSAYLGHGSVHCRSAR
jgi:hypothetical protein